ncbi:glycosyltransferase [Ancylobacter sp. 6x-1]|uniref:Glycosyltransferase n=1 Tax=Ancylobacter crimeensis TaxID=2579147 RepID=A0ABT0DCP8_9HYPH|nr:glycosyltransferase [Ancylobacter crimeensis]MCK0197738.1 glycosyltransferase [Ancylobacter crimeensis]
MRILITNNTLAYHAGSELYVFDIATHLQRRGHKVVAYSSLLGPLAQELRAHGVPVIGDLEALTESPDVIHGHHHLDVAAAALRFPSAPIVHACHGWLPWQEAPLSLPSIRRYVAVSTLTREYLVTSGIAPERVVIIPNAVDLTRFRHRRPDGALLKSALAYGNTWAPDAPALKVLRTACESRGIAFHAIGAGMGNSTDRAPEVLPGYDIVFALGRSALEALACGCAVIVADPRGMDGAVTTESLPRQHAGNLGLAIIAGRPVTMEAAGAALDSLEVGEVARTAALVRAEAGMETLVDRWEEQYRLAVADGPAALDDMVAGTSRFLVGLKKTVGHFETNWHQVVAQLDETRDRLHQLDAALGEARAEIGAREAESARATEALEQQRQETRAAREAFAAMQGTLDARIADLTRRLDQANARRNTFFRRLRRRLMRPIYALRDRVRA